ncbi:MAG: hypothetical protein ACYC36_01920 [Bellilinea sp.]|jgi:hypothetical protein
MRDLSCKASPRCANRSTFHRIIDKNFTLGGQGVTYNSVREQNPRRIELSIAKLMKIGIRTNT